MQGAGNSFLLFSSADNNFQSISRKKLAQDLCNIHFGIGADGLVILDLKDEEVYWDFYNSDGSEAEFCGNAARCVSLFLFQENKKNQWTLITRAGSVFCHVLGNHRVKVQMPAYQVLETKLQTPLWAQPLFWVNTGVPHIVVEVSSEDELKKHRTIAEQLRRWEQIGKEGANVTFVAFKDKDHISAVTFERGVEDFTLACGTGASAAALFAMTRHQTLKCEVVMPGGVLMITLEGQKLFMEGESRRIADFEVRNGL